MASERECDPSHSTETERVTKIPQHTNSIGMSSIVHGVVDSVYQIRRNGHLVDWARWVLDELHAVCNACTLRRSDAEGHLTDPFSVLT